MSSALAHKEGPYLYGEGGKAAKTFETEGIPRSFTLILAGAEQHGIVGPEANGIVVLDDDNRAVVLDRHVKDYSGYHGPSAWQQAEFERIQGLDWKDFAAFCKGNPRYRVGSVPDVDSPVPAPGREPVSERVIYPAERKPKDPACPYDFGLTTRRQIVDYLKAVKFHDVDRNGFAPSWNVKVGSFDETGRSDPDMGSKFEERYDLAWRKKVAADKDGSMFWEACQDGLRQYTAGEFSTYDGDDVGAKFRVEGRSGGHLCLVELKGTKLVFGGLADWHSWLEDEEESADETLVDLYQACVTLDHDLANPGREVAYHYACFRQAAEEEWQSEFEALPEDERKDILEAEAAGCRFYEADGEWHVEGPGVDVEPSDTRAAAARAFLAGPSPSP